MSIFHLLLEISITVPTTISPTEGEYFERIGLTIKSLKYLFYLFVFSTVPTKLLYIHPFSSNVPCPCM